MAAVTYSTQSLDHLGIVAGICRQIGLIDQIDAYGSSDYSWVFQKPSSRLEAGDSLSESIPVETKIKRRRFEPKSLLLRP